jgi:hypothetical protein
MGPGIRRVAGLAILIAAFSAGAGSEQGGEPAKVTVQHVLIGFKQSVPGKEIERTADQARELAAEVLESALAGTEFGDLVKRYSDDSFPGIYTLVNKKETPLPGQYRRYDMMTCFGNVAFELEVGEVGIADHHPTRCKFGWHVIKRLE